MSEHSDNEDRIGFFDQSPLGDLPSGQDRPVTANAAQPRDPDHEGHVFLEASNRAELARQRAGDPADAHGIDAAVTPGQWRILPGTDLEVLVVEVLDDEGVTHLVYRRRFDVPNEDHIGGARPGQHYRYTESE